MEKAAADAGQDSWVKREKIKAPTAEFPPTNYLTGTRQKRIFASFSFALTHSFAAAINWGAVLLAFCLFTRARLGL